MILDVLEIKIGSFRKLWDMTRIPKKPEKPKRTEKIIGFCPFRFFEILGINDLPSQNKYFLLDFRKILSEATNNVTQITLITQIIFEHESHG